MRSRNGFTAIETIVVVAILGVMIVCVAPAFASYRRHSSAVAQAQQLKSIFRSARSRAIARGSNSGVRFTRTGDAWTFALYDDGDGDGIRSDDIAAGIDACFAAPSVLMPEFQVASFAVLPATIRDPDGDPLLPTASPVQFGRAAVCSFNEIGGGTPGTAYIANTDGEIFAVRVYGASGRIRVLRYNASRQRWDRT